MKNLLIGILITLGVLALLIVCFTLSGLFYWGVGSFIIWAFSINFTWTFWHGLSVSFIMFILSTIIKNIKEE